MFRNKSRGFAVDYEHRLTAVEDRAKSNTKRLDGMEPVVKEIYTMSATMVTLAEGIKHTNLAIDELSGKFDRIDTRVDEIETAPGREWKKTKNTIIDKLVSGVIGFLLAGIIWAAKQAI